MFLSCELSDILFIFICPRVSNPSVCFDPICHWTCLYLYLCLRWNPAVPSRLVWMPWPSLNGCIPQTDVNVIVLSETWLAGQLTGKWGITVGKSLFVSQDYCVVWVYIYIWKVSIISIYACLKLVERLLQSSYPLWEDMVARAAKLHAALRYMHVSNVGFHFRIDSLLL